MVQTAASAARKHCRGQRRRARTRAPRRLQTAWKASRRADARGLNEEQEPPSTWSREAARVALSDSKPEAERARRRRTADGAFPAELPRRAVPSACSKSEEAREVVWASRPRAASAPARATSSPTSRAGHAEHRAAVRGRPAARRALRRPHRGADLRHAGHRRGVRAGRRGPGPGRGRGARHGPASTWAVRSTTRARACSTWPGTCPSPGANDLAGAAAARSRT